MILDGKTGIKRYEEINDDARARGKLGEHERSERDARGAAEIILKLLKPCC